MDLLKNLDNMITAEEFLLANNESLLKGLSRLELNKLLIEFAKLHVEQALKEASENATTWIIPGSQGMEQRVSTSSILNAYPLDNIK